MKKSYTAKHENGVALLFALGLLSLMSILGIAFVANSLTAQKTAVNIGARNQSQLLMDSAINRILASVMIVLRQDGATTSYDAIYSTANGSPRSPSSALNSTDQLTDQQSSLLNVFIPGQPRYDGSKSKATWLYLRDDTGKITGRMAYQVLPTGTSGISLDHVLRGIYIPSRSGMTGVNAPTPVSSTSWSQRIGKDIREFNIGKTSAFENEWKFDNTGIYGAIPANDMNIVAIGNNISNNKKTFVFIAL